jgi:Zn-dependent peptidase ImmA (M78 family)
LVDRDHPLGAVEVLRSRMPGNVESRARAFAGEFLLPTSAAANTWDRAGSPLSRDPLVSVLQLLADFYGVSFSVAAWKLEHGANWGIERARGEQFRLLRAALDSIAPYR